MLEQQDLIKLATMAMPFGKYKDRVLIDLPEAYLLWFAQKGFPEGRLGQLLQLTLELKTNGLEYLIEPLREKPSPRHPRAENREPSLLDSRVRGNDPRRENNMSIENFKQQLAANPDSIEFQQVIDLIGQHYDYTPTTFGNGAEGDRVINAAGTNEGSCRIFAFAQLQGLDAAQTLACFGKFYRVDVLQNPNGTDHANIRTFMRHGWKGIQFEGKALSLKKV